jgi:hypothetical protein
MRLDLDKPPRAQFDWDLQSTALAGVIEEGIKASVVVPPTMIDRNVFALIDAVSPTNTDWSITADVRILYGGRPLVTFPIDRKGSTGADPRNPFGLNFFPPIDNHFGVVLLGSGTTFIGSKQLNCMCDEIELAVTVRRSFTGTLTLRSLVGCLSQFPV